jgi:hypothetical protein
MTISRVSKSSYLPYAREMNVYSTYIEIRLVETIPRDIYQNIVFPSQQYHISLSTISLFEILKI